MDRIKERCEYNPTLKIPAKFPPSKTDCTNETVWSLGKKGVWHLCGSCAALPEFERFTVRKRLPKGDLGV